MRWIGIIGWLALVGCGPRVVLGGEGDTTDGIGEVGTAVTSSVPDDQEDDGDVWDPDLYMQDPPDLPPPVNQLDILVVIDNSATMGPTQEALIRGLVGLVGQLEDDLERPVDVQLMFTTTDMGHPLCEGFGPSSYVPAQGAPTTTGCNLRLDHFATTGPQSEAHKELCTEFCPADIVPGDPFVAFAIDGSNNITPGVPTNVDIDGDGEPDSAVKRAVGCLAPQGLCGCGYEAPLESMLQALDPAAPWNSGGRPFMRAGSTLVVVVATDEAECSMTETDWMFDEQYEPGSALPASAVCWNAGVECDGPDALGVYSDCASAEGPLTPMYRYHEQLAWLADEYALEIRMIAITGVPPVSGHNPAPPFEPIAGGVDDLAVHDWRDGLVPDGDMLPGDEDDAAALQELYGIGPGCAVVDAEAGHVARALPNHRVNEVCRTLDDDDPATATHCCIESACDPIAGLDCIIGWSYDEGSLLPGG